MSDHYDRYNGMENLLSTNLAEVGTDCICRQAAIRWIKTECNPYGKPTLDYETSCRIMEHLDRMPSAQPEIVRCKDCKYHDEGYRRISVKWLPCMDMRLGSNWYCGSAERRTDE